jgi:hypothetical protein
MLAMGFTTVRDMCGSHNGLKNVIDAGLIEGPRVYLAGARLGQVIFIPPSVSQMRFAGFSQP